MVTLHRPSNVDHAETLAPLLSVLREVAEKVPLVFALHPRTRANVERFGLGELLSSRRIVLLPPQGYLEILGLLAGARLVLSDSGGLQEETTALGVPCLTIRENTERPITVEQGTNTLVGCDPAAIRRGVDDILSGAGKTGRIRRHRAIGHGGEAIRTISRKAVLHLHAVIAGQHVGACDVGRRSAGDDDALAVGGGCDAKAVRSSHGCRPHR